MRFLCVIVTIGRYVFVMVTIGRYLYVIGTMWGQHQLYSITQRYFRGKIKEVLEYFYIYILPLN